MLPSSLEDLLGRENAPLGSRYAAGAPSAADASRLMLLPKSTSTMLQSAAMPA